MPPDTFWDGVATSVSHASGEIVVAAVVSICVLFFIIKYYIPERIKQKDFEASIQQKRLELHSKQQQDLVNIQNENLEARVREIEILSALSDMSKALATEVSGLKAQIAVMSSQLESSKITFHRIATILPTLSRDVAVIGGKVSDIHTILLNEDKEANND